MVFDKLFSNHCATLKIYKKKRIEQKTSHTAFSERQFCHESDKKKDRIEWAEGEHPPPEVFTGHHVPDSKSQIPIQGEIGTNRLVLVCSSTGNKTPTEKIFG